MKKNCIQKISLAGFALMGASALIAAIVPSKAVPWQPNSLNNGTLRQNIGGDNANPVILSCLILPQQILKCHVTAGTGTTALDVVHTVVATFGGRLYQTNGNTSISNSNDAADTTSILVRVAAKV